MSHRDSSSSAIALASPPHKRSSVENLSRHYAGMMQDGLRPPWTQLHPRGARPLTFFSPVQTGLERELAELLPRTTQPGLVAPGSGDQAQWYHPASLSSESGESLRHVGCCPAECVRGSRP